MAQKIKTLIILLSMMLGFSAPVLVPAVAYATHATPCVVTATHKCPGVTQSDINNQLKCGSNLDVNQAVSATPTANCSTNTGSGNDFNSILKKIINILSVLVGAIAVIMIIFGGFRYVTSAGSEKGVESAKKTILYALIGLVIVALAQVIVHFVLNNIA